MLMPHLGWVGFDPTNWLVAGDRHIRTAIAATMPTFRRRTVCSAAAPGAS
ncbi:hypothetical protein [Granulicella sp. WH15]|nr:hypothetical protein [Granulicella sp. WH15]